MGKEFDIYYFSGTHWDREWYQPFAGFRYRLLRMVDGLLDILEKDPTYETFHFDGQTVVLEDYTEICPARKEELCRRIREGRILVGPWYVMPDEFLVSGESLIRNLQIGHRVSRDFGAEAWKFGYICDIFGHIAQMPQIFRGFGIPYALLGRGTTETDPTYFNWQSPDGSTCASYRLEDQSGYGAFNQRLYATLQDRSVDNPEMVEKMRAFVEQERERSEIPLVIIMDGLDHAEVNPYTTAYLRKLAELFPEARIHHANIGEALAVAAQAELPTLAGEMNRTARDRHSFLHLITHTLSSYYPIKQQNDICQNLLEKTASLLAALAPMEGISLYTAYINHAYRTLIKNHAHDSICGCSVDAVARAVEARIDEAITHAKEPVDDYIYQCRAGEPEVKEGEDILTFVNPLPFPVRRTVSATVDFPQNYSARYSEPFGYEDINCFRILNAKGEEVPYRVLRADRGTVRRIRDQKSHTVDPHTVSMTVEIPACGRAEYRIVPHYPAVRYFDLMPSGADWAENAYLRMQITPDGHLSLLDKKTGRSYTRLLGLYDDGEIGDGWFHANPVCDRTVTAGRCISVARTEHSPARVTFRVVREMELPREVSFDGRRRERSEESTAVRFTFDITLAEEARFVEVQLAFDNTVNDHRLRLALPTRIDSDRYFAGQAFYCCDRASGVRSETQNWREPDPHEKAMNGIVGRRDENGTGLAFVSAEGLHECAAYRGTDGELTVTLMRGFSRTVLQNGETHCQLNRRLTYHFLLAPLDAEIAYADLLRLQDMLACPPLSYFARREGGYLPKEVSLLEVGGQSVAVSVVKPCENGEKNSLILRVFNASGEATEGYARLASPILSASETDMLEEDTRAAEFVGDTLLFSLSPWKIKTFKFSY